MADRYAKAAADRSAPRRDDATPRELIDEATLSYMARTATEARSRATVEWIKDNVRAERRYRPPRGEAYAASTYETLGRNWLVASTSSSPDAPTSGRTSIWWGPSMTTGAGTAAPASSRPASISLSGALHGEGRHESCVRESRSCAGRRGRGPLQ